MVQSSSSMYPYARKMFRVGMSIVPILKRRFWTLGQKAELSEHRHDQWRASEDFVRQTGDLLRSWGFSPDSMAGRVVLDLGAGSRLRTRYFRNATIYALEPLADKYKTIPFCDLDFAKKLFACPAEQYIPELQGAADLIVSINALDHGWDPQAAVQNCARYLAPEGQLLVSVDIHPTETSPKHIGGFSDSQLRRYISDAGLRVEWERSDSVYGQGPYALTLLAHR